MKRAFVFIDGSNLYHRLKSIIAFYDRETGKKYSSLNFNFRGFCQFVVGDDELIEIHYYIGQIQRHKEGYDKSKSELLYNNQQRLVSYLEKDGIAVKFGKMLTDPTSKKTHEKGVDVQIAVEMIRFARQDKLDVAYLISSDTDLLPAVKEVQDLGKRTVYVGVKRVPSLIENSTTKDKFGLSYALLHNAEPKVIEKEQIEPFLSLKQ